MKDLIKNIERVVSKIEDIMEIEFNRVETKDSIEWNERYTDVQFCKKTETIRVIHYYSKQQILLSNTIDFCEKIEFLKEPIVGGRFHSELEYQLNEIGLI